MRHARLLLPVLLALAAAGCARQQPAYYVTDSATGQRIATGQQGAPEQERGLFTSSNFFKSSTARGGSYAYAPSQDGRGLFGTPSSTPTYAYQAQAPQPYPPQTYSYRPPPQRAHAYRPPPQRAYVQQPPPRQYAPPQPTYAPQPYHQPQAQPAGYYAANYRWY